MELETVLQDLTLKTGLGVERDADVLRKRAKRSEAARIIIPDVVDIARREKCLQDPERFLRTYFKDRYTRPFGKHHQQMMESIISKARYGGRQAVAAPRGCGKSELVKGVMVYIVLAQLVRFPLFVAATTDLASSLYEDFRRKVATNDLLFEDFPEICSPVRDLDGAPQRAAKQHVDGVPTRIVWTAKELSLPHVPDSVYGGVKMTYAGLDSAFRGKNVDGDRPDFIVVDDPETRESAKSYPQIEDREKIIDRDIAGLAGEGVDIAITVLTTIQNSYCLSYRITSRDPKEGKPAFNGLRFGVIEKWPDTVDDPTDETKLGLWSEYIALRHKDYADGDEHARNAVQFYLDHQEEMEAGAEMLTDYFTPKHHDDGTQLTFSALQVAFDKIADTDLASFRTEYQNDPEEEEKPEVIKLTAAKVQSRTVDLQQGEVPADLKCRTIGLDIGKFFSHWTDTAWLNDECVGHVADYGVMETHGLTRDSTDKAIESALVDSMTVWCEDILKRQPDIVLIDSGTYTDAAYEICRRFGRPFYPAKGWDQGRFRMPRRSDTVVPFDETYARWLPEHRVWLYNVQGEHWKKWLQERFMVNPVGEDGFRVDGSLSLFSNAGDVKRHLSFAHHIVAEEERWIPKDGKHLQRQWFVKNRNNHWLDSTALACAGAGSMGVKLVKVQPQQQAPQPTSKPAQQFTNQYGQPFVATGR